MNFIPFLLCLICIWGLAVICLRVDWKDQTADFRALFKRERRETARKI